MAKYPNEVVSYNALIGWTPSGFAVTDEQIQVPAGAPYVVRLEFVPKHDEPTTVEVWTGVSKTGNQYTETNESPNPGEFKVDYNTGDVTFNSANAGTVLYVSYLGLGSLVDASKLNSIQNEVIATQTALGPKTAPKFKRNIAPFGDINDVNKDFTTPSNYIADTLEVFKNGLKDEFSETGSNSFQLAEAPKTEVQLDVLTVNYWEVS